MEGVSVSDANEIYLETVPDNFVRCLRSAQNAKSVKIKLTKKHIPCLTFEVELVSNKLIQLMIIANSVIIVCFSEEKLILCFTESMTWQQRTSSIYSLKQL